MTSYSEVKPTSDNTAPKVSLSCERPATTEKFKHHAKGGVCPFGWATRAWTAIERALVRCPFPLGCMDEHSPDHSQWLQDRDEFIALYAKRLNAGTAIKWLKFHTSYCFGYACNQSELPVAPGPFEEYELPGRFVGRILGKALQCVMARGRAGNWPARRCAYDILMSKIGDPPATQDFVDGAVEDHKKNLTSERGGLSPAGEARRSQVEEKLWKICKSIYSGKVLNHRDLLPSLRASLYGRLAKGGAMGELLRDFGYGRDGLQGPRCPELIVMAYDPISGVSELRLPYVDDIVYEFQDEIDMTWLGHSDVSLDASPNPILEPLKVRMITKGQAAEYYRCLELQKLMHGALRKHPVFQYTGMPIDDAAWGACFGSKLDLAQDEFYVSGDYKAATDNLDPGLSEFAWGCIASICKCNWEGKLVPLIETPYYGLGTKALTGHNLHYPKKLSRKQRNAIDDDLLNGVINEAEAEALLWDCLPQKWGQLMGSPMSFPILCLVNAAASLVALDQPFRQDTKMRVNGDDIAFIANADTYARWKIITAECGLQFSLGKNYTSRDFLIMNSELRRPPETRWETYQNPTGYIVEVDESCHSRLEWIPEVETLVRPHSWKLEGFLNQSLLYHTVRKGPEAGEQKDVYWTDLGDISAWVLNGIPDDDQMKVMNLFLHAHKETIKEVPPLANLWFPRELGGVGMKVPAKQTLEYMSSFNRDPEIVLKQRKLAAFMACNPKVRVKAPRTPVGDHGPLDECFKDLRALSDSQVPAILRKRENGMYFGQTILEGTELLGLVISYGTDHLCDLDDFVPELDDSPEQIAKRHRALNCVLNQRYRNWTRKGLEHSLTEMSFDSMGGFVENHDLMSYIDCLARSRVDRTIDHPLHVVY